MKKILSMFILFILCFSFSIEASSKTLITDNAELLSSYELEETESLLKSLSRKYNMDIAIYTEDEMSYKTAELSANNTFEEKGYGPDGILFYICMDEREYHITVAGDCNDFIKKSEIKKLKSAVEKHLKNNDWYGAFAAFSDTTSELLDKNMNSSSEEYESESNVGIGGILCLVLIPLGIAIIAMLIMGRKMNTARKQDYASDYMNKGSFNLSVSRDIFLYSTITKTEKPQSNSNSSSGRSYGGGGGKF